MKTGMCASFSRSCLGFLFLLTGMLLFCPGPLVAEEEEHAHASEGPAFVENMGQWEDPVLFKSSFRGGALFFERGGVTFVMQNREQVEAMLSAKFSGRQAQPSDGWVTMYAYRVLFEGCRPDVRVAGRGVRSEYHNYYLGSNPERWASGVPLYDTLCYEQLYEGVDLLYYTHGSSYKYEFHIAPNASPGQLLMLYDGADRLRLKNGNLLVGISDFETVELKPYAYQIDDSGNRKEVECRYERKGRSVRFRLGVYDPSLPLVIDPILVFCSYTGSRTDNWGYTATYDSHGNMYGGGAVFESGYRTTMGAYQIFYGGGSSDIAIMKFSTNGDSILFSTYLGGRRSEVPHSLVVNDNDELYVLASTSSWDFPITRSAYDSNFHWSFPPDTFILTNTIYYLGGIDITISKFSADGRQLMASTYFGGSGPDGLATDISLRKNYADEVRGEIMVDAYSNVYIVSSTRSRDLPVSATAFQKKYGGGGQDGCIAKFSYDLSHLIWCSYIGGDSSDAAYSMVLDKDNNIYVCGGTSSSNLPTTKGVMQPSYGGGVSDGFIAYVSTNGNQIKAMTYFGKQGFDQTYLIKTDQIGDVYVMALSDAGGYVWLKNARWYKIGSQVITKFRPMLDSVVWSTVFGTGRKEPDLSPSALMVDLCRQVYFSGWGSPDVNNHIGNRNCGTRGLPVSNDAFRVNTDDNDFYFLSLNADASNMIYGSFFGGTRSSDHVDGGTSRFDRKGFIYQAICASCGGQSDLPVTSGVAGPRNNSYNCNLGVVKMNFNIREVVADFSIPNVICAPKDIVCKNTSRMVDSVSTSYFWDFGDGTTSTEKSPTHRYYKYGTYKVRLVVSDMQSCNLKDTLERELIVLSSKMDTLPDCTICRGDFVQIGVKPANSSKITYHWYPSDGLSSTDISNPIASDTVSRTYFLLISDGVCTDTLRVRVNVLDVKLDAGPDRMFCDGDTLRIVPSSDGADRYEWSMSPSFFFVINSDLRRPELELEFWVGGTYYVRASNRHCSRTDSVVVGVSRVGVDLPQEGRYCYGDTFCVKSHVVATGDSSGLLYDWQPAANLIRADADSACFFATADGMLALSVMNSSGCRGTDSMRIRVDSLLTNLLVTDVRCHGERNGEIRVRMRSGQPPYRYIWQPNLGSDSVLSGLAGGTYRLLLEDASGCRLDTGIVVKDPDPLEAVVLDSLPHVFCDDASSGFVEIGVGGGSPPYRYSWFHGDTSLKISGLSAGVYNFFVEDSHHCTDTVTVEVQDTSDMRVAMQVRDMRCHGICDGSVRLQVSGVPPYSYQWKSGQTTDTLDRLCAGVYDVTVTDARHCRRRLFPQVKQPDSLLFDIFNVQHPRCFGISDGQITVSVTGGAPPYRYDWNGVSGGTSLSGLPVGSYRLQVTDAAGCMLDTLVELLQPDSLVGTIQVWRTPCEEVCKGKGVVRVSGGTPPYAYLWGNGERHPAVDNLCYGEGVLEVLDSLGCRLEFSYFVDDSNTFPFQVKAWADHYFIYAGELVTLYATHSDSGFTYRWSPPEGLSSTSGDSVKASPSDSVTYTVTVEDVFGCRQQDTVRIRVLHTICDHPYVFVPNTFSPNGDGVNDVLYVRGDWVQTMHFAVYDRWGEKMFESNSQLRGWDGTYRGKPCEQGVYVYYLEVECKGQTRNLLKGNVTLVR